MAEYLAAWNDRDSERIASFLAGGAVYEETGVPASPPGGGRRSADTRREFTGPDLRSQH